MSEGLERNVAEPAFVQRLREARDVGNRARLRVSAGLLAVCVPISLAKIVGCIVIWLEAAGYFGRPRHIEPNHGLWVVSLTPPAAVLGLLALTPTDASLVRALADAYLTTLLIACGGMCYVLAAAMQGKFSYRTLTCNSLAPSNCWSLMLTGSIVVLDLASFAAWIIWIGRPAANAPARWSHAYWRLVFKAMHAYRAEHGTRKFVSLFLVGGFPGACPGFWLHSAPLDQSYYALQARTHLLYAWRGLRCFSVVFALNQLQGGVTASVVHGPADSDAISHFTSSA